MIRAVDASNHGVGVGVAHDRLCFRIELYDFAQTRADVSQVDYC